MKKWKKSSTVAWQEIQLSQRNRALEFIIERRKALNWQSRLPASGTVIRATMERCIDKLEEANQKIRIDDGQFIYCVCLSDIKRNLLYTPYDLVVIDESPRLNGFSSYYLLTASCVTKVLKKEIIV